MKKKAAQPDQSISRKIASRPKKQNGSVDGISSETMKQLQLPSAIHEASYENALAIDHLLSQRESPGDELEARLTAHREASLSHLFSFHGKLNLDLRFLTWPQSLYIPAGANPHDYWFGPAPDDHRYALDWTSPASATANRASREDGTLSSFAQLRNDNVRLTQSSESGVGIFYQPTMSLGVIELRPEVDCQGVLRTLTDIFPDLFAGYVEVKAELLLAAWHQIPGGFDLLGFKHFGVASSGRRDQTFGPLYQPFQRSFEGSRFSAPFLVQAGRTYLMGVVSRITILTTLTDTYGAPLPPLSNEKFRVWGVIHCVVPRISVLTKQVYIP